MIEIARRKQLAAALVLILGLTAISACAAETAPAGEEGAAGSGPTAGAVTTTEPSPGEGGAAANGPSLADEMRTLTAAAEDAAAANTALAKLMPELGKYEVDEAAILALGREYLEAGDDAMAEVVFSHLQMAAYQVTGAVSADLWAAQGDVSLTRGNTDRAKEMYETALGTDPAHAYSKAQLSSIAGGPASPVAPAQIEPRAAVDRLSEGRRPDLARFRFKYEEANGSGRELWISETCYNSGVLRAVPQWGDKAPWVFKSVSEAVFEQVDVAEGAKPVRLEFELHHGHGGILGLDVSGGAKGRFDQGGYLPEGFEPEIGTCD
jgi:hypothetical protein